MSYVTPQQPLPPGFVMGVCDVHRLLEGDTTLRPVAYCKFCNANLCQPCSKSPLRRARAAALKAIGR